jgi:glycosyltransferase EpsE
MNSFTTAFITVYNEEQWISRAVESLMNQTLQGLEILVVDDGSTDGTRAILSSFQDPRLRVIVRHRAGRAESLAFACREAKGKYLANLDADDEAYPTRLEKQVRFLDSRPDHAWVGCGEDREDSQRKEHVHRLYPETDEAIRRQAARCIPYCHSGVTFRRSLIEEGINYDPRQPFLIDFEFFLRVARYHKVANLPEVLVKRRARQDSYFQSRFTTGAQNRRLAWLCTRAVREFALPPHYYTYPAARLVYPLLPSSLKRPIRRRLGLEESHV